MTRNNSEYLSKIQNHKFKGHKQLKNNNIRESLYDYFSEAEV